MGAAAKAMGGGIAGSGQPCVAHREHAEQLQRPSPANLAREARESVPRLRSCCCARVYLPSCMRRSRALPCPALRELNACATRRGAGANLAEAATDRRGAPAAVSIKSIQAGILIVPFLEEDAVVVDGILRRCP
jgi:hypothetical protein